MKMKKYEIEINNEVYRVSVTELDADADMNTHSNQTNPAPETTKSNSDSRPHQSTTSSDGLEIKAPMAGSIYKIVVAPGDTVSKGDTVIVLEAMKMENEIVAPQDGVVGEIFINLNERVESGQLLLTL